jgi:hypothetical protein
MMAAEIILLAAAAYMALGLLFGVAFVLKGVGVVDPAARSGPVAFRLLILPASAALWPVMARKWMAARGRSTT